MVALSIEGIQTAIRIPEDKLGPALSHALEIVRPLVRMGSIHQEKTTILGLVDAATKHKEEWTERTLPHDAHRWFGAEGAFHWAPSTYGAKRDVIFSAFKAENGDLLPFRISRSEGG